VNSSTSRKAPAETPLKPLSKPPPQHLEAYGLAMSRPKLAHIVEAIRISALPAGMRTRIVAIDGPGGAGKSTLAEQLARELDAPIVHTDDFASWDNPIEWWPDLIEKVLRPIAAGQSARYRPTSWGGPTKPQVALKPGNFVVLEGVSASREAFRPFLAFSIWVETPQDVRLRRGLDRDGEEARADWVRWMAEEDAYAEREHPSARADVVVRGDERLWT
jgi:uridine kinase